jgi:uncharacterized protein YdhG (YjbR/CyaY superfamily)
MRTSTKTPKTIDEYLAGVSDDKRAALQKLRKAIRSAVPTAEECIAYQIPSFRLDGRFLLSFGAAAKHCAFYPGSAAVEVHRKELKKFGLSTGTIRFQAADPLPPALVRKLVKTRVAAAR